MAKPLRARWVHFFKQPIVNKSMAKPKKARSKEVPDVLMTPAEAPEEKKEDAKKNSNLVLIAIIAIVIMVFLGCALVGGIALFLGLNQSAAQSPTNHTSMPADNTASIDDLTLSYPEGWQEVSVSDLTEQNPQAAQIAAMAQSYGEEVIMLQDEKTGEFAIAATTDKLPPIAPFLCNKAALDFAAAQMGGEGAQIVSAQWQSYGGLEGCELGLQTESSTEVLHVIASNACGSNQTMIVGGNSGELGDIFASIECP